MENNSDNVAEIEKYAFLLGSAIRNEDSEQFFSIYDSILPPELPDIQLDLIKQKAREVAELPESEFNDLVIGARNFSLAPNTGQSAMTYRETAPRSWNTPQSGHNDSDDDDDEGVCSSRGYSRLGGGKSETLCMRSNTKISTMSSESDIHRRCDDDSGLCNSSKATNSVDSLSDHDGSDYDGRTFDYFPPAVKIRSGCGMSLDYDEAHEVKSEDSSTNDINSPRSDLSDGIEMSTFSSRKDVPEEDDDDFINFRRDLNSHQNDFGTDNESDEGTCIKDYYKQGYRPLVRAPESDFQPTFSSQSFLGGSSASNLRRNDVDTRINFVSLKGDSSHSGRYSRNLSPHRPMSDKVRIEKNMYSNKKDPPFGHGADHLDKVAQSVDSLISRQPDRDVKNMPEGRKLEPLAPEESKKIKKKKKRLMKEDANDTDVNGNPIADGIQLNKTSYLQMRESPSAGSVTNSLQSNDPSLRYDFSSSNKDSDELSSKHKLHNKLKKVKKEAVKKAEEIENYIGNKTVDELVEIITGQDVSSKKSKKAASEDVSKAQKANKKNKDKKQKSPTPSNSLDELAVKGGNSAQSLETVVQKGDMGNSSGKGDVNIAVEHSEAEAPFIKKESKLKSSKSLLKDSDKPIPDNCCNSINISSQATIAHSNKSPPVVCRETVKEKDTSRTNNKREAVVDGSVHLVGAETKKKSDKSAKAASEASMPDSVDVVTSKSEGDNCVANSVSVKQKNAKNKKSKPNSPTVKTAVELPAPLVTAKVAEIQNHQPLYNSITREGYLDDDFIFTDFDTPAVPKEDEFQVVGKKKKKPTKEPPQQNMYQNNGNGVKQNRRLDDKPRVSNNSSYANNKILPNPQLVHTSPVETDNTNACDLSPSSFPALGSGKGRQSVQEGRRNSTGDVTVPSDLKNQDDSDIESVKSLPAIQGHLAGEMVSPRLNMSYAKMAAASTHTDTATSTNNSTPVPGSGDNETDPKKAVWKGSPTERRHSIGSSPEGVIIANKVVSNAAGACVTANLKAGSQENIVGQVKALIVDSDTVPIPNAWMVRKEAGNNISGAHLESVNSVGEGAQVNKLSGVMKSAVEGANVRSPMDFSSVALSTNDSSSVGSHSISQTKTDKTGAKPSNNNIKPNSSSYNSSVRTTVANSNSSVQKQPETTKTKAVVGNNNNKKVKSVIFLDKRVEEATGHLDISFGFEMEPIVNNVNKTDVDNINPSDNGGSNMNSQLHSQSMSTSSRPISASDTSCSDSFVSFTDVESVMKPCQNSSSKSSVINEVVLSNTDSTQSEVSIQTDNDTAVAANAAVTTTTTTPVSTKHLSQLTRLNGVVPPAQGQHGDASTGSGIKQQKSDSAHADSVVVEVDKQSKSQDNVSVVPAVPEGGVLVYYGEGVTNGKGDLLAPSQTNGPTRYCGLVIFLKEKEIRSNFNVAEAATYLTTEWNRTLKHQKETHPK